MVKKAFLLATTALCFFWNVNAQTRCATDQVRADAVKKNPQILLDEAKLKAEIDAQLYNMGVANKGTTDPSLVFDTSMIYIPIVFHIVHEYGYEYVSDYDVYDALKDINDMYNHRNADTTGTVICYTGNIPGTNVRYATNAHITFVMPTRDPAGNPTTGITRHKSYLSYLAGDQAKLGIWPPDRYMNVWIVRNFSSDHYGAAAYAYQPPTANSLPFWDGVITSMQSGQSNSFDVDHTVAHELGHELNLAHPWGNTNQPGVGPCSPTTDDDVDDTPPTLGHTDNGLKCNNLVALYDTLCALGYAKTYSPTLAHKLFNRNDTTDVTINFPDTTNAQNVMDYTYCSKMFSYMQGLRMRAALYNTAANRDSLWTKFNVITATKSIDSNGNIIPRLSLPPVADFSIDHSINAFTNSADKKFYVEMSFNTNVFTCPNGSLPMVFRDRSWRAPINSESWTFSNNASSPTATGSVVPNIKFGTPGWVSVKMVAKNNTSGSDSITNPRAVYVADPTAINGKNYIQEFSAGDTANYPTFNYFNNNHYWEVANNVGMYDNHCMMYHNFDNRTGLATAVNSPVGDYDDFYTPKFDFTQTDTGSLYLNFFSSGAFISNVASELADTLQVSYSTNCGFSWTNLKKMVRSEIGNNGAQLTEYTPSGIWNWQSHSIQLPGIIKSSSGVFFRFRFYVGGDAGQMGTGNDFYLDRISFSHYTADVSTPNYDADGIAIAPNPTTNSSFVIIKEAKDKSAQIVVTDLTGKVVYVTETTMNVGTTNRIEIPASVITVKGMYLVQILTETSKHTEKLVVY